MNAPPVVPPLPLENCYWVVPGLVLAGEHPEGSSSAKTRQRLQRLLGAGIESFLDLTQPSELPSYDEVLPRHVIYSRRPIPDHGLPGSPSHLSDILTHIGDSVTARRPIYVHCRAGIGRTGLVMGCLLIERGLSGDDALRELNQLWQQCRRSKDWAYVPETEDQTRYVRDWVPRTGLREAKKPGRASRPESASDTTRTREPAGARESARLPTASTAQAERDPLLEPDTLSAARGLRDRFLGALVGLAVGDAVAAATQYRRPGSFTPVGDMLGGGPFDLPRGGWSDDTAMALCLAESLLESNGFDARDQVTRYVRWQQEGYLSATGQCVGITASTARALGMANWRRQLFAGSHDPKQLDPEPLSSVVSVALYFFPSPENAVQQAADAARTTCQAPAVLEACRRLARALHAALSGQPKPMVVADVRQRSDATAQQNTTASAAFEAACWAFASGGSFRDAVLKAVNVGGNSDVVAAVCGALAGAYYGIGAIPAAWRNSLMQREMIEEYADRLLTQALLALGG